MNAAETQTVELELVAAETGIIQFPSVRKLEPPKIDPLAIVERDRLLAQLRGLLLVGISSQIHHDAVKSAEDAVALNATAAEKARTQVTKPLLNWQRVAMALKNAFCLPAETALTASRTARKTFLEAEDKKRQEAARLAREAEDARKKEEKRIADEKAEAQRKIDEAAAKDPANIAAQFAALRATAKVEADAERKTEFARATQEAARMSAPVVFTAPVAGLKKVWKWRLDPKMEPQKAALALANARLDLVEISVRVLQLNKLVAVDQTPIAGLEIYEEKELRR